jgi:prepilin signal peptidase PulO-like enzyme (type II secretory pathway)
MDIWLYWMGLVDTLTNNLSLKLTIWLYWLGLVKSNERFVLETHDLLPNV